MKEELTSERRLGIAIEERDLGTFAALLKAFPEHLRDDDESAMGGNLLVLTAGLGLLPFVQCLVREGVNVDAPSSPWGKGAAIIRASARGQVEVVSWLIAQGASLHQDIDGQMCCVALHVAAQMGHLEVVKLLVQGGALLHATLNGGNSLTEALGYGQSEVAEYLRSIGLNTPPPNYEMGHEYLLKAIGKQRGDIAPWSHVVSGVPPTVIYCTEPRDTTSSQTAFTVGLSDRELLTPGGESVAIELSVILPSTWRMGHDPMLEWPLYWLARLSLEAMGAGRWPAAEAAVLMNGDPPEPLANGTKLCGWIGVSTSCDDHRMPDSRWITLLTLVPIYDEERVLIEANGYEELLRRFDALKMPSSIDPHRPNVGLPDVWGRAEGPSE